jgi:hypothetical protein
MMKYRGFFYIMKDRKAFQFYRSYYDVVSKLKNDTDKLDFLMALLQKQFEDIEPQLTGLADFAYVSQKHSIDTQVKGYQSKVGYVPPTEDPSQPPSYVAGDSVMTTEPPTEPPYLPPSVQEKEKEKEKEQLATSNAFYNVFNYTDFEAQALIDEDTSKKYNL